MGDTNYLLSGVILQVVVSLWVCSSMSSSEFHVFFATGFVVPQELSKSQLCGGHHCREPPQWALRMSGKFSHQIIASSGTSSRQIWYSYLRVPMILSEYDGGVQSHGQLSRFHYHSQKVIESGWRCVCSGVTWVVGGSKLFGQISNHVSVSKNMWEFVKHFMERFVSVQGIRENPSLYSFLWDQWDWKEFGHLKVLGLKACFSLLAKGLRFTK